jgi:hypothetical protein
MRDTSGSKCIWPSRCFQSFSFAAHRLAAWRVKVVRCGPLRESREPPSGVVAPEVFVKALVCVYPQELAHDLHAQHFRVIKFRIRTALAQLLVCGEPVIDYAENGDDEGVKIHSEPRPPFTSWLVRAPPSVEEVSVFLQSL